ncbi:MAG TPA: hypothetical protein ENN61_04860 [Bacteroidaceae bacterium]|nr:hypothetical protein [Bacteroidaceae bacterium]
MNFAMKYLPAFICLVFITGCRINVKDFNDNYYPCTFYAGTYTGGDSEGIYTFQLMEDGNIQSTGLKARVNNPSFLTLSKDGKYLLAISEMSSKDNEGSVVSYVIKEDSLAFVNRTTSGGAHPCFVAVNSDGYVLTANYNNRLSVTLLT